MKSPSKTLADPDDSKEGAEKHLRYEVRERIGEGSMGLVYRVFDRKLLTEVALKTFRFAFPDPEEIYRLKHEFRSFLSYRGDDQGTSPLLGELTAADDDAPRRTVDLEVGPLAPEETRNLVNALMTETSAADEPALRTVVAESEGSPFFVGELARYLASGGDGDTRSALTMADVVRGRLRRQSDLGRDLLEIVATSRGPIPLDFVLRLGDLKRGGRALVHDLCAQCLLRFETSRGDGQLDIYHDRIRDTVLGTMDVAASGTRLDSLPARPRRTCARRGRGARGRRAARHSATVAGCGC